MFQTMFQTKKFGYFPEKLISYICMKNLIIFLFIYLFVFLSIYLFCKSILFPIYFEHLSKFNRLFNKIVRVLVCAEIYVSLHKKSGFPLKIALVNVTKSAVSYEFAVSWLLEI